MAKFCGMIGYSNPVETVSGVWVDQPVEHEYFGDVIREVRQSTNTGQVNDDLSMSNRISIVADDFARDHLSTMKYVIWLGAYWKISNVEVQRPRLILTIGGVYNGPKA